MVEDRSSFFMALNESIFQLEVREQSQSGGHDNEMNRRADPGKSKVSTCRSRCQS